MLWLVKTIVLNIVLSRGKEFSELYGYPDTGSYLSDRDGNKSYLDNYDESDDAQDPIQEKA